MHVDIDFQFTRAHRDLELPYNSAILFLRDWAILLSCQENRKVLFPLLFPTVVVRLVFCVDVLLGVM